MADPISITGIDKLLGALTRLENQVMPTIGRALYEEALDVAQKADLEVPYDTGALARSQIVHKPQIAGDKLFVDITYGGPAVDYALKQHETMWYSHPSKASGLPPNGRKAKYLEDPATKAMTGLDYRLSIRVEAIVRGLA